ncbi:MAG: hypothetical protein KUG68_03640, partial [Flavobacteriaceae bacterium]|nr:hypothetical protein [Flavobacteriaceae bacterium]
HEEYYNKIPKDILHDFNELEKKLSSENVPVINFSQHDYENKYFFNSDHLNHDGATKFTNELITILKTERFEK